MAGKPFQIFRTVAALIGLGGERALRTQFGDALRANDEAGARIVLATPRSAASDRKLFFDAMEHVSTSALARTLAKELLASGVDPYVKSVDSGSVVNMPDGADGDPMSRALESGDGDLVVELVEGGANLSYGRSHTIFHPISNGHYEFSGPDLGKITHAFMARDPELPKLTCLGMVQHSAVLQPLLAALTLTELRQWHQDLLYHHCCRHPESTDPECIRLILAADPPEAWSGAADSATALGLGNWTALEVLLEAGYDLPRGEETRNWHALARACKSGAEGGRQFAVPMWVVDLLEQDDPHLRDESDRGAAQACQEDGGWEFFAPAYAEWEARQLKAQIQAPGAARRRM